ncbi:MAG TPA: M43 family zinc metalloprotease, partial [Flavobacteriales bacterium]
MNVRSTLLSFTALATLCWSGEANAQLNCGTDEMHRKLLLENPALAEQEASAERDLQELLQAMRNNRDGEDTVTYYIPVVFHILHDPTHTSSANNADAHNISDAQCLSALNILNRDFRKDNADTSLLYHGWGDLAAGIRIQFRLATKDPFGNCTNGINRITTLRSSRSADFSKLDPWQRNRYLNVWVVNSIGSEGTAGYSNYPSSVTDAVGALRDGVLILNNYFGLISGGTTQGDGASRALTHEVGHWLNLAHVWGDNNGEDGAPAGSMSATCGNDGVEDTPITRGHSNCAVDARFDFLCNSDKLNVFYDFNSVTPTSGTTDPTPVSLVTDTIHADSVRAALVGPFRAVGLGAQAGTLGTFNFAGWNTGAANGETLYANLTGTINTSKYYSFVITPEDRYAMTLDSISFKVGRSLTGPRTYAVRIGTFSSNAQGGLRPLNPALQVINTGVAPAPVSTVFFFRNDTNLVQRGSYSQFNTSLTEQIGPIEIRIYAWNAEDEDGTFLVEDLRVHGKFGITDNIQNYMEYSYCEGHMFTFGQRDRMRAAAINATSGRSNLWTPENHMATGIMGNETACAPATDMYAVQRFVCVNTPVQMRDNSENFPTSWAWEFPGGNPSTSTEQHPVVEFTEPGPKNITLTTSNADGSSTVTKENVLYVAPPYAQVEGFLDEHFSAEPSNWPVLNLERNPTLWHRSDMIGRNGPGCMTLNSSQSYNNITQDLFNSPGSSFVDRDELATPALDLRFASNLQLHFWYAYATSTSTVENITEMLKVEYSITCGRSWLDFPGAVNDELTGANIVTAGVASSTWTPQSGDWREITLNLPNSAARADVRIRFTFTTSMFANDIFIDDVSITGNTVGVEELEQSGLLNLMPNPATDEVTVELGLAGSQKGMLSFLDMTGREVFAQGVNANDQRMTFDLKGMGLS